MTKTQLKGQDTRALLLMGEFMPQQYPGVGYSAGIDVEADRVIVKAGEAEVARLGPKEWFMTDQVLRDFLRAQTMKQLGPGHPPPLREPSM